MPVRLVHSPKLVSPMSDACHMCAGRKDKVVGPDARHATLVRLELSIATPHRCRHSTRRRLQGCSENATGYRQDPTHLCLSRSSSACGTTSTVLDTRGPISPQCRSGVEP